MLHAATGTPMSAVSAQALAVDGGTPILGSCAGRRRPRRSRSPARYGTLHHPGDQYALDMFAQIGRRSRAAPTGSVLGGLHPQHIVAVGESQSAFYLTTFADALQPVTHTFDGIFIHSRGGTVRPSAGRRSPLSRVHGLRIRTDLTVPVFMFETQTDLIELGYAAGPAAQHRSHPHLGGGRAPPTPMPIIVRAAAAGPRLHHPHQRRSSAPRRPGRLHRVRQVGGRRHPAAIPAPVPTGQHQPGRPGPRQPRQRDRRCADPGGRRPGVDPQRGGAAGASAICSLFGSAMPFRPATLAGLYHTKSNYLSLYQASLDKAIAGGYILGADRAGLLAQANQVQLPS